MIKNQIVGSYYEIFRLAFPVDDFSGYRQFEITTLTLVLEESARIF